MPVLDSLRIQKEKVERYLVLKREQDALFAEVHTKAESLGHHLGQTATNGQVRLVETLLGQNVSFTYIRAFGEKVGFRYSVPMTIFHSEKFEEEFADHRDEMEKIWKAIR